MNLYGGTTEARSLFDELLDSGKLFFPYSKENFISFFEDEDEESWCEFIKHYGRNAENHLAVIYLDQYDKDTSEALVKIFLPLHNVLTANYHKPDFLIINLSSRQILAIGLGRKNRFFAIDGISNNEVWCWDFGIEDGDKEYIHNFTSLDSKEVVYELISDLSKLGSSAYQDYLNNSNTTSSFEGGSIFEKMFSLDALDLDTGDY